MSMTNIKRGVAVGALSLSLLIGGGSALAVSNGGGNSANAPGQEKAWENCIATVERQIEKGVQAGGGPKAGESGPANCDHYWQYSGAIGN